jgi:RNA polymerase sigma factor (sigma-70 family)
MSTITITNTQSGLKESIADLLRAVSDGDTSAWEEILRRYSGLVAAAVRSFRLQDADALDAIQTTWLHLVENHHQIRSPERLAGWLATTARRECLRLLRAATRTSPTDLTAQDTVDLCVGPEQQAVDVDTAHTLRTLLTELTPRQQTLLRALFGDRSGYTEVVALTGILHGSIGPTRTRALIQLRHKLEEHELT